MLEGLSMRNLRSHWNSFYRFCQAFSLVPLAASPLSISSYAVFLTQRISSYQYIMGHLNSIRLLHLYHGLPIDSYLFRSFTNQERSQACFGYCHSLKTLDYAREFDRHTPFSLHLLTISRHNMGLVHGILVPVAHGGFRFISAQIKLGFADDFNL